MQHMQHPGETTDATFKWNTCNIQLQHTSKTHETYIVRCHGVAEKFGPTLSCKQSTVSKAANGVCRCGPALVSQTGKRPSRPYNWLSWSTKAATWQAAWGRGSLGWAQTTQREKKAWQQEQQGSSGQGGLRPWARAARGWQAGPVSSGRSREPILSMWSHACTVPYTPHAPQTSSRTRSYVLPTERTGAGPHDYKWAPLFFFLGVTRVGLVHSSSLN